MHGGGSEPDPDAGLDLDGLRAQLARRQDQIAERIRELAERRRALAEPSGRGSTPEELARARACVDRAQAHARDAHLRAAERHEQASETHLRAAELLDSCGRPDLAQRHRAAAEADREGGEAERAAAARDAWRAPSRFGQP
jgi:hypothetical protein